MSSSRNGGANQYGKGSKLDTYPELPGLIQGYLNANNLQKDLPHLLKRDHGIVIGLRTVQDVIRHSGVQTVRKSGLTPVEKGVAILELAEDDPLSRWGCRLVQEKLAKNGTHISRDFIMEFRRLHDPDSSAKRHPITRKAHKSMIWSLGPNEEWCIDGHEKIFLVMGIAIWGIIDKFSRKELGLWAIPNARLADVPPALQMIYFIFIDAYVSTLTEYERGRRWSHSILCKSIANKPRACSDVLGTGDSVAKHVSDVQM